MTREKKQDPGAPGQPGQGRSRSARASARPAGAPSPELRMLCVGQASKACGGWQSVGF